MVVEEEDKPKPEGEQPSEEKRTREEAAAAFKGSFPKLPDEEIVRKYQEWRQQKKQIATFKKFLVNEELIKNFEAAEKQVEIRENLRREYFELRWKTADDDLAHLRDWEKNLKQDGAPIESLLQLETVKKLEHVHYSNAVNQVEAERLSDRQYLNDFLLQAGMVRNSQKIEQVLQEMKENSHPLRQFVWILGAGTISGLVVGFVTKSDLKESPTFWIVAASVVLVLLALLFERSIRSWVRRFGK